jgi:hypothetical protein
MISYCSHTVQTITQCAGLICLLKGIYNSALVINFINILQGLPNQIPLCTIIGKETYTLYVNIHKVSTEV